MTLNKRKHLRPGGSSSPLDGATGGGGNATTKTLAPSPAPSNGGQRPPATTSGDRRDPGEAPAPGKREGGMDRAMVDAYHSDQVSIDCFGTGTDSYSQTEEVNRLGGRHTIASQGAVLENARHAGVAEADRAGICWEVCRRWIRARAGLDGGWVEGETIYDLLTSDVKKVEEIAIAHRARVTYDRAENFAVEDLDDGGTLRRTYSFWGRAQGLKSRQALLDAIFNTRGLYILVLGKQGGHAVAFDTRGEDGHLVFMDPNTGEVIFASDKENDFRQFFHDYYAFWFKDIYHRGFRFLTQYTPRQPDGPGPIEVV
jgi:hypothetical protein